MLFSSIIFLFYFLPITMALYFVIPGKFLTARNLVLFLASLVFYSWGEPVYVMLMLYSAFFNYYAALQIAREKRNGGTGKRNLCYAVIVNLFILGFFKYFGFLMDTINGIFGAHIHYTALALPIGISFYTFQAMSHIFYVYRDNVAPQKNFLRFALYLSLFPQLIAGPIVKYLDIEAQLSERTCSLTKVGQGATRFIFGLGKKVILANNFGALFDAVQALPGENTSVVAYWLGILAFTLQIYFDFSGYSDMAIGLGKIFGFDFNENFNYPYISKTITEFWRRWHISLSSWFREYVHIPLGDNRVTVHRHILNLSIVWALTGLWHGASWNFVMWGVYYGALLIVEKYFLGGLLERLPAWALHVYTMILVMIGWVFFSITDLGDAVHYIGAMFGGGKHPFFNIETMYLIRTNWLFLLAGIIAGSPRPMAAYRKFADEGRGRAVLAILVLFGILIISVAYLVYGSYNPFLYFRF